MSSPLTREELYKYIIVIFILCIIAFVYYHIKINKLESEIDKLDYNKIYNDKTLYEYINQNKNDIKDINNHLKNNDLNIDKLNTVINSYVNSSIQKSNTSMASIRSSTQKSNTSNSSNNSLLLDEINHNLQAYISLNDDKLDNYILATNAKIDELTEANLTIMDSINNINNRLT